MFLLPLFVLGGLKQTPELTPEKLAVLTTIHAYAEAVRTFNQEALDSLFAPEYAEVSPLGELDGRAKTLAFYDASKKPAVTPSRVDIDQVSIQFPAPTVAVAIIRETFHVTVQNQDVAMPFRATIAMRKPANQWILVSTQATAIRKAD